VIGSPYLEGRDRCERAMDGWVDNTHEDAFTHTVRLTDDDFGVTPDLTADLLKLLSLD